MANNPFKPTDNPCRNCPPDKRSSTCHSQCQDYINWEKNHKSEKDKLDKAKKDYYLRGIRPELKFASKKPYC